MFGEYICSLLESTSFRKTNCWSDVELCIVLFYEPQFRHWCSLHPIPLFPKKNPKTFDQMFYKIFKKRKRKRYANLLFNAEKLCWRWSQFVKENKNPKKTSTKCWHLFVTQLHTTAAAIIPSAVTCCLQHL